MFTWFLMFEHSWGSSMHDRFLKLSIQLHQLEVHMHIRQLRQMHSAVKRRANPVIWRYTPVPCVHYF